MDSPPEAVDQDASFGILPMRREPGRWLFLIIQNRAGHWGFPKGHAEGLETPLAAACRELQEETGIKAFKVDPSIQFTETYRHSRRGRLIDKTVTYFPAIVDQVEVNIQVSEVRAYAWLEAAAARARITYPEARRVFDEMLRYLGE